jgi:predicted nucleic acid-binding protein
LYARAEFVVSSDDHLLDIREFEGMRVIRPADILKKLTD